MESIGIRDRIVIQHRAGEQSNRRTIPIEFVILVIASRAGAKIGEVVHEFDGRDPLHIEPALADSDSGNNALLRRQPMAQQNAIVRWGEGCLDGVVNGMGGQRCACPNRVIRAAVWFGRRWSKPVSSKRRHRHL